MADFSAVNLIASLFRADREIRPLLLLGAGASFRSGVPMAAQAVNLIARRASSAKSKAGA